MKLKSIRARARSNTRQALSIVKKKLVRPKLTYSFKNYIAWCQKWTCAHCEDLLPPRFQIDHIIPISESGNSLKQNLQALCGSCHDLKSFYDQQNRLDAIKEKLTGVSKFFNVDCFAYWRIQ